MYKGRRTSQHFREELNKFIKAIEINSTVEKKKVVVCPWKNLQKHKGI
jgi:hypothetical protein